MHTFQEVIDHFGGITALAGKLNVSTQAISQWDGRIPETRAFQIEVLSEGRFKASKLPVRSARRRRSSSVEAA